MNSCASTFGAWLVHARRSERALSDASSLVFERLRIFVGPRDAREFRALSPKRTFCIFIRERVRRARLARRRQPPHVSSDLLPTRRQRRRRGRRRVFIPPRPRVPLRPRQRYLSRLPPPFHPPSTRHRHQRLPERRVLRRHRAHERLQRVDTPTRLQLHFALPFPTRRARRAIRRQTPRPSRGVRAVAAEVHPARGGVDAAARAGTSRRATRAPWALARRAF